jgi:hypothetical protein
LGIGEVLDDASVQVKRQHPQLVWRARLEGRDESSVDAQDRREVSREFPIEGDFLRLRDREGRRGQGFLETLALGDVVRDREHVRLATVPEGDGDHLGLDPVAILAQGLELGAGRLAGQRTTHQLVTRARIVGLKRGMLVAAAQDFLPRPAVHLLECRVDVDAAELGIPQDQCVCGGVEDRTVLRFAVAQGLVGTLALRDVGGDAAHGVGVPFGIEQRKLRREESPRSFAEIRHFLELYRLSFLQHAQVVVTETRGQLR